MSILLPPPPREQSNAVQWGQWYEVLYRAIAELRSDLDAHTARFTDWVAYTPTGSFNTNTTYTGFWRRVGDSMQVRVHLAFTGAPNSATLSDIDIPTGYTIDTAKLLSTSQYKQIVGVCNLRDEGTASIAGLVYYKDTGSVQPLWIQGAAAPDTRLQQVSETSPFTIANTDTMNLDFVVPITGWGA
jgi:hypothetical protein